MDSKWQDRFLKLAEHIASFSKDPTSKVGCVIVDHNKRVISQGFNGFAVGVEDTEDRLNERDVKLNLTLHSEINAIIFAKADLEGCTIFTWPYPPCSNCAAAIIQSGIKTVICPNNKPYRWKESFQLSEEQFQEAKVKLIYR